MQLIQEEVKKCSPDHLAFLSDAGTISVLKLKDEI